MNVMLQRTISGVVFVAPVVGSIVWGQYPFGLLFAVLSGLAVREFHLLTNVRGQAEVHLVAAVLGAVLLFATSFVYASGIFPSAEIFLCYGGYVIAVVLAELFRKRENPVGNVAYFLTGQVCVAIPFAVLNFILFQPSYQPVLLLALFVTIWMNDTGAYLTGNAFGRHRLFERVSPRKSWEGFAGGAAFALLSGYVFSRFLPIMELWQWLLFSVVVVAGSTLGDLCESLLKRTLQVKDSGHAIPGHGGFLDRFDSMLLAAPMTWVYLLLVL